MPEPRGPNDADLEVLMRRYAGLQRMDVLRAYAIAGPRHDLLERELMRMQARRAAEVVRLSSRTMRR